MLETLELVRTQEPVVVVQLQSKIPRDLETICLKCLHKEPNRRYLNAAALAWTTWPGIFAMNRSRRGR